MRTIFISAGHTNVVGKDRGAFGSGFYEGELAVQLRDMFIEKFKELKIPYYTDNNANPLVQTLAAFKALVNVNSLNIDIHFNASANPTATGCEVLIKSKKNTKDVGIASAISHNISQSLQIRDRGVKDETESARGKLGWFTLTGTNILIEVCFISNRADMDMYQLNKKRLVENVCNYLITL